MVVGLVYLVDFQAIFESSVLQEESLDIKWFSDRIDRKLV
jgi:hypothetical protein